MIRSVWEQGFQAQSWQGAPVNSHSCMFSSPQRSHMTKSLEVIEHDGIRYAEVIWSGARADKTVFFSPPESSFQFGLLAHEAGFVEPPHYHKPFSRTIDDLQQMFVVQRGIVAVQLYSDQGALLREIVLHAGDAIVLIHGIHAIRVIEDMQCISVKQGPFLGPENDKVLVRVGQE